MKLPNMVAERLGAILLVATWHGAPLAHEKKVEVEIHQKHLPKFEAMVLGEPNAKPQEEMDEDRWKRRR